MAEKKKQKPISDATTQRSAHIKGNKNNVIIDLRTAQVYWDAFFLTCWHPSHITISFLL